MFFKTVLYCVLLQILSRKSREEKYNRAENNITSAVPSTTTGAIVKENTVLIYLRELASHPILKGKKKGEGRRKEVQGRNLIQQPSQYFSLA